MPVRRVGERHAPARAQSPSGTRDMYVDDMGEPARDGGWEAGWVGSVWSLQSGTEGGRESLTDLSERSRWGAAAGLEGVASGVVVLSHGLRSQSRIQRNHTPRVVLSHCRNNSQGRESDFHNLSWNLDTVCPA